MDNNEKTFTQEEVNAIVSKRLQQEREKYDKEFSAKSLKLQARATLIENGLSGDLVDALNLSDEETAKNSLDAILKFKATNRPQLAGMSYVPRRDSGGVHKDGIRAAMGLPE